MSFLYVAHAATYFTSLKTVPAAVTHILLYLCPVVVMLLAAAFLGERLGRRRLAALGLAVAGVFAVVDPLSTHGSIDAVGFLVGLATAAINVPTPSRGACCSAAPRLDTSAGDLQRFSGRTTAFTCVAGPGGLPKVSLSVGLRGGGRWRCRCSPGRPATRRCSISRRA